MKSKLLMYLYFPFWIVSLLFCLEKVKWNFKKTSAWENDVITAVMSGQGEAKCRLTEIEGTMDENRFKHAIIGSVNDSLQAFLNVITLTLYQENGLAIFCYHIKLAVMLSCNEPWYCSWFHYQRFHTLWQRQTDSLSQENIGSQMVIKGERQRSSTVMKCWN